MNLFGLFIVCNIVNVIIQTVKTLATVKCGKFAAALVNALAYGFYTYIIVLTNCDLPLMVKCFVVGACNLIGVYIVKHFEEKARKDKLWKIEATIDKCGNWEIVPKAIKEKGIPCNYIDIGKYIIINCFCETQSDSKQAKEILDNCQAKYFVTETKIL